MDVRTVFLGVVAAGLTLPLVVAGCGGAQEEYRAVSRPVETSATYPLAPQRDEVEVSAAIRRQLKACIDLRAGQWSERSYAIQYDAKANDRGEMVEIKLRGTTMQDDDVVGCLQQVIAAMTLPENALRSRSSRPFSGGERMKREQRGLVGSSDSENPLVLLGPFIIEAVGVEVIIEVGIGIIAAVGTLVWPLKLPKDECLDKYVACMDSPLGNLQVEIHGTSVCATCKGLCERDGGWPMGFKPTGPWQTCM
jgi:hypothetical protein